MCGHSRQKSKRKAGIELLRNRTTESAAFVTRWEGNILDGLEFGPDLFDRSKEQICGEMDGRRDRFTALSLLERIQIWKNLQ